MAQTNIALASDPGKSVITYPFGGVTDRIRRADIVGELNARKYLGCETGRGVSPMGQTYSTTSRTMAITRAVDDALARHRKSKICTTAAGCYLSDAIWASVVSLAVLLANRYYTTAVSPAYSPYKPTPSPAYSPFAPSISPTYSPTVRSPVATTQYVYGGGSPVPGVPWVTQTAPSPVPISPSLSPSLSPSFQTLTSRFKTYFGGAPGPLGQAVSLEPLGPPTPATLPSGWSSSEKWAFALDLLQKGLAWATSYLQAKAERDRLIAMGTNIPQMTAQEVQQLLMQYKMLNPGIADQQLKNVGAGLLGQPKPSAIPTWVWPIAAGLGVLGVLMYMKKR